MLQTRGGQSGHSVAEGEMSKENGASLTLVAPCQNGAVLWGELPRANHKQSQNYRQRGDGRGGGRISQGWGGVREEGLFWGGREVGRKKNKKKEMPKESSHRRMNVKHE